MSINKNRLKIENAEGKVINSYLEVGVYDGSSWSLNLPCYSGPSSKRIEAVNPERDALSIRLFDLAKKHGSVLVKVIVVEDRKIFREVSGLNLPDSFTTNSKSTESFHKFLTYKIDRRNVVYVFDKEFDLGTLHYDVTESVEGKVRELKRKHRSVLQR